MTDVAAILNAHPRALPGIDQDALVIAVQECLNCAQSCTSCADACIADPSGAHLGRSAGAALNCADMATAAVRVLSRPTAHDRATTEAVLRALIETCREGYEEHRQHALENEACGICAEACRRCGAACRHLLGSLG
ncbi:four-helix bundle copper-binding protein [Actinoplanes sp. NPDC048791]|uniref:four-helix bundle copper-binding protein n=1 Tax=Actinoplanes sp. NPDC048791 TaxID=3154623 RepID=UPI0033C787F0